MLDAAYAAIGLPPPECHVQCESFLALPEIVAISDVVAMVPRQLLEQPSVRGRMVRVPVKEKLRPIEINLLTRAGVPLTPIGKDFVGIVRGMAGGQKVVNF